MFGGPPQEEFRVQALACVHLERNNLTQLATAACLRGRKLRPQSFSLSLGEPKHEVFEKALAIAPNLFVEALSWDFIQLGQINVEHHLVPANQIDSPLDELDGDARQALTRALPGSHGEESNKRERTHESQCQSAW